MIGFTMSRQTTPRRLPHLVRFLLLHAGLGAVAGCCLAIVLLTIPSLPIGTLMAGTETPYAAAFLYFGSFAFTFASLAMGAAVMTLPWDDRFPD